MMTHPTRQAEYRAPRRHDTQPRHRLDLLSLAARLTDRDRWLLRMLAEHRVLTSQQINELAFTCERVGRRRLLELYRYGVIDRFTPQRAIGGPAPAHYVLDTGGAAVLAAEHGIEVRELRWRRDRSIGIAVSMRLAHTIGVNEWFISLATHNFHHDTDTGTLSTWWSQTRCKRLYGDLTEPDGYGRWNRNQARLDFFLEFDLATEKLDKVANKLKGYADLASSTGILTPVLFWLPTARREANARRALRDAASALDDPGAVPIATAAADLLDPTSPHPSAADRVWLPLHASGTTGRVELHKLTDAWPRVTAPPEQSTDDTAVDPLTILPPPAPLPPSPTRSDQ
ncbi:replication-relaxation family protein [Nocardia sp. CA-128927]|uniref:replication-relaxation family protein n=1 Tax=Nocardia sp. CA-128927 TaxID=3239975 RepID=UPI003D9808FE